MLEDTPLSADKRWVLVAPSGATECALLLARALNEAQQRCIGNQSGGRVFFFLHTDDFWRDYEAMRTRSVEFVEEPREEAYGTVVVFHDLYGNKWDLVQRSRPEIARPMAP